jgi:diguanylate cyclase (GGDEF)-like protein
MTALSHLVGQHDLWLVALAALIGLVGCWAMVRLTATAAAAEGIERLAWVFIDAVAAGASIWCTHFVGMLAYHSGTPASYEPLMTAGSLIIAIGGCFLALLIPLQTRVRHASIIGGVTFGQAVSAMHFAGMQAYAVDALVQWKPPHVVVAVLLAIVLGALAFDRMAREASRRNHLFSMGLLALTVLSLHFTAMAALVVVPLAPIVPRHSLTSTVPLALTVAIVSLVVVGAAFASYAVDYRSRGAAEARLRLQARNDALTMLPNRSSFITWLDQTIASLPPERHLALVSVDLDEFAEVNDAYGQDAGDQALAILGSRLSLTMRQGEFVARMDGDQFAALADVLDRNNVLDLAERLERAICAPIHLDNREISLKANIGIAFYPDDCASAESLLNGAHLAMLNAKTSPDAICFYRDDMEVAARQRRRMVKDLRSALERGEFEVYYQVQQTVADGAIVGYEALIRWTHPELGRILPDQFVPLAEATGLIIPIGAWVLRTACAEAVGWPPNWKIAVNLSPAQFADEGLLAMLEGTLAETGLPAARLELELTESTVLRDPEKARRILSKVKDMGISLAMDDFGTGYSSLANLHSLSFDRIKLDKSFTAEIELSEQGRAIVRAVLAMGKALGIPILAEGVETQGQLDFLLSEGCEEAQGYLLGRPGPMPEPAAAPALA